MTDDRIRRWLDGELPWEDLPEALRLEARAWRALADATREARPGRPPADLEERVWAAVSDEAGRPAATGMAEDRAGPEGPRRPSVGPVLDWLVRGRTVRVSPLAGLAAAAALAALILRPWAPGTEPGPTAADGGEANVVYVQFVLEAPGATAVAVVGDFNGWAPTAELADADGDGVWTGRVPLNPGVHRYMFLVDGSEIVPDPTAERYVDDGFGNRNALLALPPPPRGT